MSNGKFWLPLILTACLGLAYAFASGTHGDHDDHEDHDEPAHAEEAHSEDEDHEHEHEHEESAGGNVGPNKGILEASEKSGFKLSPEATKNFDLKFKNLVGKGPWLVPKTALVHSGEDVSLFRLRSGFFKRVDFKTLRASGDEISITSDELQEGDGLVLAGLGFLRVAELAAFGGVAHGHSH